MLEFIVDFYGGRNTGESGEKLFEVQEKTTKQLYAHI